jgi:hypothetical protein
VFFSSFAFFVFFELDLTTMAGQQRTPFGDASNRKLEKALKKSKKKATQAAVEEAAWHDNVLKLKKPKKFPNDRAKWATYENIEEMYNRVYQALVDSGVAKYTDESKTKLEMLHPKYLLFGDELGINTNMKDSGNRKEKRVIGEVGGSSTAKESASASDNKATILESNSPIDCYGTWFRPLRHRRLLACYQACRIHPSRNGSSRGSQERNGLARHRHLLWNQGRWTTGVSI